MVSSQLTHYQRVVGNLSADLAFINGKIRTMSVNQPTAEAVAIKHGKIFRIDTTEKVKKFIGKDTKVIDLNGKTMLPGLIDAHIHIADLGRCLMWLDLTAANSRAELRKLLEDKSKQTAKGKWIIGRGWNQTRLKEKQMPTCQDLDIAAPDNPVILYHEMAMVCVVNSKALKLAGVSEQTTAPKGGAIEKKEGKLTGILYNSACNLVWQVVPEPSPDELFEATALACQNIVESGLTSVHWLVLSAVELPIVEKLHIQGKLPMRVNLVVPEAFLQKTEDLRSNDKEMLRLGGAIIAVDGYLDSKTAALLQPYSDDSDNRGKLLLDEQVLIASVRKVLDAGLQPIIHAMGDRAVDTALKVIEHFGKDVRFCIEQAALLNPGLIGCLKGQNLVISVQPKVIASEFLVWSATKHLGLARAKWLHPLKSLTEADVKIAGGSDCPMEPLSPLLGIQEAVLREEFKEQRLSVLEALRLYTVGAAYSAGEENLKGTIEEGKFADLTILSSDPTSVDPEKIKDIEVKMTIVNGKLVYSAAM